MTRRGRLPTVAIVGRPNVGKSTLFNRLTGTRKAITEETAGVTRDRLYGLVEWGDRRFDVVDTGGLELDGARTGGTAGNRTIAKAMLDHAFRAVEEADAVIAVFDATEGLHPVDRDVLARLRGVGKPVLYAVNKVDHATRETLQYEFYEAGVEAVIPISAEHGRGISELLDRLAEHLPEIGPREARVETRDELARGARDARTAEAEPAAGTAPERIRIAIVGRPNVGKSSLVNRLLGFERSIVSEVAGTTRDAVDTALEAGGRDLLLIDTAGIRRKARVHEKLEKFSVVKALEAVRRADIAVLVVDPTEGIPEQDAKIAGEIEERGKGAVIAVSKWDRARDLGLTEANVSAEIRRTLAFIPWAPIVFTSAVTGGGTDAVIEAAIAAFDQYRRRVPTPQLNRWLAETTEAHPPPVSTRGPVKLTFVTMGGTRPPTIVVFTNQPAAVHFSYRRHLQNAFRARFGFDGTPVRIVLKKKRGKAAR